MKIIIFTLAIILHTAHGVIFSSPTSNAVVAPVPTATTTTTTTTESKKITPADPKKQPPSTKASDENKIPPPPSFPFLTPTTFLFPPTLFLFRNVEMTKKIEEEDEKKVTTTTPMEVTTNRPKTAAELPEDNPFSILLQKSRMANLKLGDFENKGAKDSDPEPEPFERADNHQAYHHEMATNKARKETTHRHRFAASLKVKKVVHVLN